MLSGNGEPRPIGYNRREVLAKSGLAAGAVIAAVLLRRNLLESIPEFSEVEYSMPCDDVLENLDGFLAENVQPDVFFNMGRHLECCGHCLSAYQDLGGNDELIQKALS